jgi:hypothetical protein
MPDQSQSEHPCPASPASPASPTSSSTVVNSPWAWASWLGLGQQPATTGAHRWKAGAFALVASCGPYHPTTLLWPAAVTGLYLSVCCFMLRLQIVPAYTRLPDHTGAGRSACGGAACVHWLVRAARPHFSRVTDPLARCVGPAATAAYDQRSDVVRG